MQIIYKTQMGDVCTHNPSDYVQEEVYSASFDIREDMEYCTGCEEFVNKFQVTTLEDVVDGWEKQLQLFPSIVDPIR